MEHTNTFLEKEPVSKLMRMYSVPCIISLLVAALYNIVDQIFIANASYLGSYGNAANTVVFPLTIVALAIAVMIGDGTCAYVSILLGMKKNDDASGTVGNAILLTIVSGLVITALYLGFLERDIDHFFRDCKRRDLSPGKRVFLLDHGRHSILYVWPGHEPHYPVRRKSSFCHGFYAGRCGLQHHF